MKIMMGGGADRSSKFAGFSSISLTSNNLLILNKLKTSWFILMTEV